MTSMPLTHWRTESRRRLDEFENAHVAVSGGRKDRGRRYLTEQLNQAYLVAVAAHFQKFCRDLHAEAISHLMRAIANRDVQQVFLAVMTQGRKLDVGNANGRIFDEIEMLDSLSGTRKRRLDQLVTWRNAIGHQDFAFTPQVQADLGSTRPTLPWVRRWRRHLDELAMALDEAVAAHLGRVVGARPW